MKLAFALIASLYVGTVSALDEAVPSTSRKLSAFNVPYTFAQLPPLHPDSQHSPYKMKDSNCSPYSGPGSSAYYSSPDRPNDTVAANAHQYADGGDPTFYMILDLASSIDIDRLRVRNGNSVMAPSWGEYCVKDYEVSVSDSVNSGYSAPISGTLINNELFNQDILVGLTGRYIKFKFLTYCEWGVVIRWVEVLMVCKCCSVLMWTDMCVKL